MPRIRTAHKFTERQRTGDVLTDEFVDFKSLLLSSDVLKGLSSSGFERPSPIQLKAIPLGRCGLDLIAQAKSGTGKTCVFTVIALESLLLDQNTTQVLILAPTREIAVQIKDVISAVGSQMNQLVCHAFIGGLPVEEDKKLLKKASHIVVGTPGRIKSLIENGFLKTDSVRLFILDEADKLLEDNFQEQINWIFSSLPPNKQVMAFSATYPEYLAKHLTLYMREPTFVRLNANDPTLQGIKQFYQVVSFHPLPHKTFEEKILRLLKLLSSVSFNQCLVFSNYQIRAQSSQSQSQRLKAIEKLKEFKCRVLISTDLTSRGIDAEHVNLVVNMDVPRDHETYLHRIGRAGRFGTQGIGVTFVAKGEEEKLFKKMEETIGVTIDALPDPIPQFLCTNETPKGLSSKSVQPCLATVDIDIMKKSSAKKSDDLVKLHSLQPNTMQNPARFSDEFGCNADNNKIGMEQERCVLKTAGDIENKSEVCLKQNEMAPECGKCDTDKNSPSKTENVEQGTSDVQQKVQARSLSSLQGSSTCENCYGAERVENSQSTHTVTQNNSGGRVDDDDDDDEEEDDDDSDNGNSDDGEGIPGYKTVNGTCAVKIEKKQVFPHNADEKFHSSLAGEIMTADFFTKLQGLNFESCPEIETLRAECKPHLAPAGDNESRVSKTKHAGNNKLPPLSVEGKDLSKTLSTYERLKDMNLELEVTSEELSDEYDIMHDSKFDTATDNNSHLPSVEEFERYFEKYLKNGPSFEQHNPHSSDSITSGMDSDTEDDDGTQSSSDSDDEGESNSIDEMLVEHFHSVPCNYVSKSISPYEFPKSSNSGLHIGPNRLETLTERPSEVPQRLDSLQGSYNENTENSIFENHPSCVICYDKSCDCQLKQCWPDHFSTTNFNWHETSSNDWLNSGTRRLPPSSQQYFHQPYDQDSQWNLSWYNAYHRQVDYIKQFVSLSRGCAFVQVKERSHWA
ncbi:putative ATP-dependent RNA helicase DDX20 [Acropora cervicornis]|uniref:RNA helicase n=1 Tax=Acropora cervicornis TaxID=6130 RepID=A0AAD9R112_ACRCE|nr:putative ATP-dependent RNA helicase DDX20 [Acropora cervicornis]